MYALTPALRPVWGRPHRCRLLRSCDVLVAVPVTPDDVGRPRSGALQDPLHIGEAPPAEEAVAPRLADLACRRRCADHRAGSGRGRCGPCRTGMTMQTFTYGSGLVARAVDRLVLGSRGLDPTTGPFRRQGCTHRAGRPTRAHFRHGRGDLAGWMQFTVALWRTARRAVRTRGLIDMALSRSALWRSSAIGLLPLRAPGRSACGGCCVAATGRTWSNAARSATADDTRRVLGELWARGAQSRSVAVDRGDALPAGS